MSTSQNTNKSNKQNDFSISEEEHREIRIQAAIDGSLTPNQYAKKILLEKIAAESTKQNLNLKES